MPKSLYFLYKRTIEATLHFKLGSGPKMADIQLISKSLTVSWYRCLCPAKKVTQIKPFVKLHVTQHPLVSFQKSFLSSISLPLGLPDPYRTQRQCILLRCLQRNIKFSQQSNPHKQLGKQLEIQIFWKVELRLLLSRDWRIERNCGSKPAKDKTKG